MTLLRYSTNQILENIINALYQEQLGKSMGVIESWWAKQRGKQLTITSTACGIGFFIAASTLGHMLIFPEAEAFVDFIGASMVLFIVAVLILFVAIPEYLHLNGLANTIKETMEIKSKSEFNKKKADAEQAVAILGGVHEEKWKQFIEEGAP